MTARKYPFGDVLRGCQLQVSTSALEALRRLVRPAEPDVFDPSLFADAASFTGLPVIVCEEWAPGTWALVGSDGAVIESGVFA